MQLGLCLKRCHLVEFDLDLSKYLLVGFGMVVGYCTSYGEAKNKTLECSGNFIPLCAHRKGALRCSSKIVSCTDVVQYALFPSHSEMMGFQASSRVDSMSSGVLHKRRAFDEPPVETVPRGSGAIIVHIQATKPQYGSP